MKFSLKLPPIVSPRRLREAGVLGMNQRNHAYIMRYNRRADYPDVDDKLRTKELAIRYNVSTAGLIGSIAAFWSLPATTESIFTSPTELSATTG